MDLGDFGLVFAGPAFERVLLEVAMPKISVGSRDPGKEVMRRSEGGGARAKADSGKEHRNGRGKSGKREGKPEQREDKRNENEKKEDLRNRRHQPTDIANMNSKCIRDFKQSLSQKGRCSVGNHTITLHLAKA